MQSITILNRTTKSEGAITLRFRLRDGRAVDITHRSGIKADLRDLDKLDAEGKPTKGTRIYNRHLAEAIAAELETMRTAYTLLCAEDLPRNNATFARYMERAKNGTPRGAEDLESRFAEFIKCGVRDGIIGAGRYSMYEYTQKLLHRFLIIDGAEGIKPAQFDTERLLRFRAFVADEYKCVNKYPSVYADEPSRSIPTAPRGRNTTTSKIKMLQAFFTELDDKGEIMRSPFRTMGKQKRRAVLRERYDSPAALTAQELQTIRTADVPAALEETRTAFVLQCALGCRIGDFKRLRMDNIGAAPDGTPFVHYLPEKTKAAAATFEEICTPLVRYAFDIVRTTGLRFRVTQYATGKSGYNVKIKQLLKHCGIDRPCTIFDNATGQNKYVPLYELGSSKLARKTAVDILTKAQVNMYAAGLHKKGSEAVRHYSELTLQDRFVLMCYAYEEKPYKVTKDLQVVECTDKTRKGGKTK